MAADGWVKLWRTTLDSAVGQDAVVFAIWARILLMANHSKGILRNGTVLQPGEAIVSTAELAKWAKISARTVRRIIQVLAADGALTVLKSDRNGTHVSICNWGTYQQTAEKPVRDVSDKCHETAFEQHLNGTQKKNGKNEKKKEKGRVAVATCPPTVEEVAAYIREKGYQIDAEAFIAGNTQRGWKTSRGATIYDWKATVVTWEKFRREREQEKAASKPTQREPQLVIPREPNLVIPR